MCEAFLKISGRMLKTIIWKSICKGSPLIRTSDYTVTSRRV